jgi:hypothetical protein
MRKLILVGTIFVILPFVAVTYVPQLAAVFPAWPDKFGFVGMVFTVYGFYIALIAVYQFIQNSTKYIKPIMQIRNGSDAIELSAGQFPFEIDMPFYVFNKGNISIEQNAANYKLLVPKSIGIRAVEGIVTENGTMFLPTHSYDYAFDINVQTLGADIKVKVYPLRSRQLFVLRMKFTQTGDYKLRYYFTTDTGFFPKGVRLRNYEPVSNLGSIHIRVKRK